MTDELKPAPCPFCGGEVGLHENDWANPPVWGVYCLGVYEAKCGVHGPERIDKSEAIAAWNRRSARTSNEAITAADLESARQWIEENRAALNDSPRRSVKEFIAELRAKQPPTVTEEMVQAGCAILDKARASDPDGEVTSLESALSAIYLAMRSKEPK